MIDEEEGEEGGNCNSWLSSLPQLFEKMLFEKVRHGATELEEEGAI